MKIGIFTTLKVKNGIPLFWDKHHKRLVEQSKKLNLGTPVIPLRKITNYLQKDNLTNCVLKIVVMKQNDSATVIIEHRELPQITELFKTISVEDKRNYRKIYKTTDRTINEYAKKLAENDGADDALFTLNETLIESTIANIFSLKKGKIITPPIKARGLNGITRQMIMGKTNVIETEIHENTKGPLVLVNCLRIQNVTHLNGKKLLDGRILLNKLQKIILECEEEYLTSQ